MFDIHCHLLPGIDDGPATLEAALALAQALLDDGITDVVCTPHVYPGRYDNTVSSVRQSFQALSRELLAAGLPLRLHMGGEVRLTPEVLDLLEQGELPFIGEVAGYRTMLLEMPDGQVPLGALNFVRHLLARKVRPVLVHPERNRGVMERVDRLRPLVDAGCYVQLTAGSLVGAFGERAQATAYDLIDNGWVHAVASDAHNLGGRRPRMRDAAQWLAQQHGAAFARELTVLGPAGLCGNNAQVNQPQPALGQPRSGARPAPGA